MLDLVDREPPARSTVSSQPASVRAGVHARPRLSLLLLLCRAADDDPVGKDGRDRIKAWQRCFVTGTLYKRSRARSVPPNYLQSVIGQTDARMQENVTVSRRG